MVKTRPGSGRRETSSRLGSASLRHILHVAVAVGGNSGNGSVQISLLLVAKQAKHMSSIYGIDANVVLAQVPALHQPALVSVASHPSAAARQVGSITALQKNINPLLVHPFKLHTW